MLNEPELTLQELADAVGVEARTIRSWIAQDLLKGPTTRGRGATYGQDHLDRLRAIRALKELYGLSLAEIRRELLLADADRIRDLAARLEGGSAVPLQSAADPPPVPARPSALDYIRAVQASATSRGRAPGASSSPVPSPDGRSGVDRLLSGLEALSGPGRTPRRAQGEAWFRIPITPDIELSIRGALDPDRLARLERIADHLREILLAAEGSGQTPNDGGSQ